MKIERRTYRGAILVGFGLVAVALAYMVALLVSDLRSVNTAERDNTQWSISQLDTEFANLHVTLSEQLNAPVLTEKEVQLRIDIALSRLAVINSGKVASLFAASQDAAPLIAPLNIYAENVIAIADKTAALTRQDLIDLLALTKAVRPDVRKLALLGVALGAEQSQARNAEFAGQLALTGGVAIGLLVVMAGFMLLLNYLLSRAARRDQELLNSSKRLSSMVAASLDAIVTADEAGQIIEFNAAAENIFGWTREEILGQSLETTLVPPHLRAAHHKGMQRYLETKTPRLVDGGRVELVALRKSGAEFPVELNITSISDGAGTQFIAYLRDISERKITEQKLIEAKDRAERTDKAKSQFLAVMSHEMRTPLNGILGVLDLLKTTKLSKKQQRYARIATSSSEILLEHVNEALDITRIETGSLQLTPRDFDLADFATSVVATLEPMAQEKALTLSLRLPEKMRLSFHGDSNRIRQILVNLIGNAIKFTEEGQIELAIDGIHGPYASTVTFSVIDTGAGIAPDHQEQVFEDFVALAYGEGRQTRGDGLGLSISRKIARQMGGDIHLKSEVGAGATFTLTVSLRRTDPGVVPKSAAPDPELPNGVQQNVLIVEDNDINRKLLADMLDALGHQVTEAANGAIGLEKAQAAKFDVILMDISMPVMGGLEATKNLRSGAGPNAKTPIFGLTAHGREEYRQQADTAGMDDLHTKPIRMGRLTTILSTVSVFEAAPEIGPEIDLETAPETAPQKAPKSMPEALRELVKALGGDKIRASGLAFFGELDAFLTEAQNGAFAAAPEEMAEAAHKLKGAAVMFGQDQLSGPLEELEQGARRNTLSDAPDRVAALAVLAKESRDDFCEILSES